jgi:hypothetical protein
MQPAAAAEKQLAAAVLAAVLLAAVLLVLLLLALQLLAAWQVEAHLPARQATGVHPLPPLPVLQLLVAVLLLVLAWLEPLVEGLAEPASPAACPLLLLVKQSLLATELLQHSLAQLLLALLRVAVGVGDAAFAAAVAAAAVEAAAAVAAASASVAAAFAAAPTFLDCCSWDVLCSSTFESSVQEPTSVPRP